MEEIQDVKINVITIGRLIASEGKGVRCGRRIASGLKGRTRCANGKLIIENG